MRILLLIFLGESSAEFLRTGHRIESSTTLEPHFVDMGHGLVEEFISADMLADIVRANKVFAMGAVALGISFAIVVKVYFCIFAMCFWVLNRMRHSIG
jgi:hypothetical protein